MKKLIKKPLGILMLSITILGLMLFCSTLGAANISIAKTLQILCAKLPFIPSFIPSNAFTQAESYIICDVRLPRIVMSVFAGMALSVCGATYQSIFRNPLTDPYILGVSSGASLGAAIAIILGFEHFFIGISGFALIFGLAAVYFIYKVALTGRRLHTATLLLAGVSITFLCAAIISFLIVLRKDKMEKIIFWTMGSFSSVSWSNIGIIAPFIIVGVLVILFYAKQLNLLLVGDETARTLGVETERIKKILLFFSTLMVGAIVSCAGVIGFVGLVIPHIVRMFTGADNRLVIPYSIFVGAGFMLLADTFSRTVVQPSELPVGSITALIGAPFFIYLLYKSKKQL